MEYSVYIMELFYLVNMFMKPQWLQMFIEYMTHSHEIDATFNMAVHDRWPYMIGGHTWSENNKIAVNPHLPHYLTDVTVHTLFYIFFQGTSFKQIIIFI